MFVCKLLFVRGFVGAHVHLFFFQAEDGIRDIGVTGVQTCALPIYVQSQVFVDMTRGAMKNVCFAGKPSFTK